MSHKKFNKHCFYFSNEMLQEVEEEAKRLNCNLSVLFRHVWKLTRHNIKKIPADKEDST